MEFFIEKNIKRQIKIVHELINRENYRLFLKDLADLNETATKTTRKDINELNNIFPEGWHLSLEEEGAFLNKPVGSGLSEVYKAYIKESFLYRVLSTTFVSKPLHFNLNELSNRVFISKSHIYKKIMELNEILPDEVDFNIKTLSLVGDDLKILLLYWILLCMTEDLGDFGLSIDAYNECNRKVKVLEQDLGMALSPVVEKEYTYWLLICTYYFTRNSLDGSKILIKDNPYMQELKKIFQHHYNPFTEEEYFVFSLIFLLKPYTHIRNGTKQLSDYYQLDDPEAYENVLSIIEVASQNIDPYLKESIELTWLHFYIVMSSYPRLLEIAYPIYFYNLKNLKEYQLNFQLIKNQFKEELLILKDYFEEVDIDTLISALVLFGLDVYLTKKQATIKVKIEGGLNYLTEFYLGQKIKSRYQGVVEVLPSSSTEMEDITVIDSFFSEQKKETVILQLDSPISQRNWSDLDYMVNNFLNKETNTEVSVV